MPTTIHLFYGRELSATSLCIGWRTRLLKRLAVIGGQWREFTKTCCYMILILHLIEERWPDLVALLRPKDSHWYSLLSSNCGLNKQKWCVSCGRDDNSLYINRQYLDVVWWTCYPRFLGGEKKDKEHVQGTKRDRRIECETVEWANRIGAGC